MKPVVLFALVVAGMAALAPLRASAQLAPGLWSIEQTGGGPPGRGPRAPATTETCYTEAQLAADPILPMKPAPAGADAPKLDCAASRVALKDGKVSYGMSCKGPMGKIAGTWSGTYSADAFEVAGRMKAGPMSMRASTKGRRIGECHAANG